MRARITRSLSGAALTALATWAVLSSGAAARPESAPPTSAAARHLEEWRRGRVGVYMNDFAELGHYRAANARLPPPAAGERRVVFFGDSITEAWPLERDFPGKALSSCQASVIESPKKTTRFSPAAGGGSRALAAR